MLREKLDNLVSTLKEESDQAKLLPQAEHGLNPCPTLSNEAKESSDGEPTGKSNKVFHPLFIY